MTLKYYSQNGQDDFLDNKVFKHKKDGVFFDVGANDGKSFSNTYFFEKHRNWTGICIEPIPEVYDKLKKNRSCITIKGCIDKEKGNKTFNHITGYAEMLSGIPDYYDTRHQKRIKKYIEEKGGSQHEIQVECFELCYLAEKYSLNEIDYLSIDTEGNEFRILEAIDLNSLRIRVISVENNYNDSNIRRILLSNNFILLRKIGEDEIYLNTINASFSQKINSYILNFRLNRFERKQLRNRV